MKAPFIWFGGKRKVAPIVWEALGDVDNYVEPFAGSLAVLLERPAWHARKCETVNDADRYLANLWRALAKAPEAVAEWADWPVNEADLLARHLWLVQKGGKGLGRLEADPDFFDAKAAGWWVWGINQWIGSGWCSGNGPWSVNEAGELEDARQRPHLGDAGKGVNRKLPHLGNAGKGVNRQRPHLGDAGQGVNRQRPHLGDAGQGVGALPRNEGLFAYFADLASRLRSVRVCCGDWSRVVTDGALSYGDTFGVFLDPPYLGSVRTKDLYAHDDHHVADDVREWAVAHGDDPRFRIVLAGYEPEHEDKIPASWRRYAYSASAAYQSAKGARGEGEGVNEANRKLERLWFSPHCLGSGQKGLFS